LHEQERKDGHGNRASPTKVLSPLASARREATLVRAAIAQGRDPLEEVRAARQSGENTLQAVIEICLRQGGCETQTPLSSARLFERYVLGVPGKHLPAETTARIARIRLGAARKLTPLYHPKLATIGALFERLGG
jgi:hypothetical protein